MMRGISMSLACVIAVGCPSTDGDEAPTTGTADAGTEASGSADSTGAMAGPCSVFEQDCPPGSKCLPAQNSHLWVILESDEPWCSPLAADVVDVGEACVDFFARQDPTTPNDDCGEGLLCWGVDQDDGTGRCERLCGGTAAAPECPAGSFCPAGAGLNGAVCVPECDPLAEDCPAAADACFVLDGQWGCFPRDAASIGTQGRQCGFPNDCATGHVCVAETEFPGCSNSFGGCCARVCDLEAPGTVCTDVDDNAACTPWPSEGDAPGGYPGLGVCFP
jgi:hypothetical protein